MESTRNALKVLITEDDPAALLALDIVLRKKYPDAVFYTASDGRAGMKYCMELLPDIVITDIIMPEIDGCRLAREIKKLKADTKLIMFTGLDNMSGHFESLIAGIPIDHLILKPVSFEHLFAALDQCIAQMNLGRQVKEQDSSR